MTQARPLTYEVVVRIMEMMFGELAPFLAAYSVSCEEAAQALKRFRAEMLRAYEETGTLPVAVREDYLPQKEG